jgi:hypothetical protein
MWSREFARKFVFITAKSAAATLGGTTLSCVLAIYIEGAANRALFRYFPQWFEKLDYVPFGLDPHRVEAVQRHYRHEHQDGSESNGTSRESMLLQTEDMMESFALGETIESNSQPSHFLNLWRQSSTYDEMGSPFLSQQQRPEEEKQKSREQSFWWKERDPFLSRQNILACAMTG